MRKRRVIDYGDGESGGGDSTGRDASLNMFSSRKGYGQHRIVYHGEEVIESGPSRITIDDLERMERRIRRTDTSHTASTRTRSRDRERSEHRQYPAYSAHRTQRQRRGIRPILAASIALLPTVIAAPPVHRPVPSAHSPTQRLIPRQTKSPSSSTSTTITASDPQPTEPESRIDEEPIDYDIQYLTSMSTPTQALPTDVYVVDEQRLPFYMTQDANGQWTKVDDAWFIYGRRAGVRHQSVDTTRCCLVIGS